MASPMSGMWCCICFKPVTSLTAWQDEDGVRWDICSDQCARDAGLMT